MFVFITGRVKDYFKTIHGKFVAPTPIENVFADNEHTEQICLLGRGYSKTVIVCVLSEIAQGKDRAAIEGIHSGPMAEYTLDPRYVIPSKRRTRF